jgi:hypothetical protein
MTDVLTVAVVGLFVAVVAFVVGVVYIGHGLRGDDD